MTKSTPLARGVRTFAAGMVGVLLAAQAIDWTVDRRAGIAQLTLGTVKALVAGGIAALAAYKFDARTPLQRAFATLVQYVVAGAGTIVLVSLTSDAISDFGFAWLRLAIEAVLAGATTLAVNAAEDRRAG